MPAVQFSHCENLRISFERTHSEEMNGKNRCAYLGILHGQNCLLLFVWNSPGAYCVHFQTIELNEIL